MIRHNIRGAGFTIVELMLVMTAMSVLLLAVLYATLHAGALYEKGVTNRTVNQVSRDISDGLRRDFMVADPTKVQVQMTGTEPNVSGRLCLGTVSYLWNSASLLTTSPNSGLKTAAGSPIVFTRVNDVDGYYCTKAGGVFPSSILVNSLTSDVLSGDGRSLAVYSLKFKPLDTTASQGIYDIALTIGTNEAGTTQSAGASTQCKPPTDNSANFNYCSLVDLDMIVRSGGKT